MKTKKEIESKINEIIGNYRKLSKTEEREVKKLREILLVLEADFSEEFFIKQLKELSVKLNILNDRYLNWYKNTPGLNNIKNPKKYYEDINAIPLIKRRIKNLKYILN